MAKLTTIEEYNRSKYWYEESDTVFYRNEIGDTLKMLNINKISIINIVGFITKTSTHSQLHAELMPIDKYNFAYIYYRLIKYAENEINKEIYASRPNYDYQNSISRRFFSNEKLNNQNTDKFTLRYDKYIWNDIVVDNCLIFTDFDTLNNETFKFIYSNIFGFLYIKDKQYEIIKL